MHMALIWMKLIHSYLFIWGSSIWPSRGDVGGGGRDPIKIWSEKWVSTVRISTPAPNVSSRDRCRHIWSHKYLWVLQAHMNESRHTYTDTNRCAFIHMTFIWPLHESDHTYTDTAHVNKSSHTYTDTSLRIHSSQLIWPQLIWSHTYTDTARCAVIHRTSYDLHMNQVMAAEATFI